MPVVLQHEMRIKFVLGFLAEINKSITFKTFFNGRNTK
jgi:hypothetical protein